MQNYTKLDKAIGLFLLLCLAAIVAAVTYRVVRWIGGF